MTTYGVRAAPGEVPHQGGAAGHNFSDGFDDNRAGGAFRLFLIPVEPAVALLKEVGEAGQHDDFTEDAGVRVITAAEGHDKSQPSGCILDVAIAEPDRQVSTVQPSR